MLQPSLLLVEESCLLVVHRPIAYGRDVNLACEDVHPLCCRNRTHNCIRRIGKDRTDNYGHHIEAVWAVGAIDLPRGSESCHWSQEKCSVLTHCCYLEL